MSARRRRIVSAPWVDLCAAILRRVPKLEGALCAGRAPMFDGDDAEQIRAAAALCHRCPALDDCAAWLASVSPPQRPPGVTAARFRMRA